MPIVSIDRDVVYVAHERLAKRCSEGAVAQAEPLATRLKMHNNLAVWKRVAYGRLNLLADLLPLDSRLPRRDRDDGIGAVVPAGFPNAQAPKLDPVAQVGDRGICARVRLGGRGVHQPGRGRDDK